MHSVKLGWNDTEHAICPMSNLNMLDSNTKVGLVAYKEYGDKLYDLLVIISTHPVI